MQRLFETDDKIGIYCDSFSPRTEKRKDGETKVIDLTLRVQPLTPELASTIAGGDNLIKKTLFKLTDGGVVRDLKSVAFELSMPRQLMTIFAAPDVEMPSIAFDQVEISDIRARKEKGVDGWGLVFYASLGPLSKNELEFVVRWYTNQQFVTFAQADPSLFDAASDERPAKKQTKSEAPDGEVSQATEDSQRSAGARQNLISHAEGRRRPH